MVRHDTKSIVAELQRSRQVRRTITPEQVEELESLGYDVHAVDAEPNARGRKTCIISQRNN